MRNIIFALLTFTTLTAFADLPIDTYDQLKIEHVNAVAAKDLAQEKLLALTDEYAEIQALLVQLQENEAAYKAEIAQLKAALADALAEIEELKAVVTPPTPVPTGFKVHPKAEQPATTFKYHAYIDPVNGVNSADCSQPAKPCKSLGYNEISSKSIKAGTHIHLKPGMHAFISFYGPYGSPLLKDATEWTWFDFEAGAMSVGIHLREVKRILVTGAYFKPAPGKLAIETSGGEHLVFDRNTMVGVDKNPQDITVAEWNGAPSFFSSRSVRYIALTNSKVKNIRSGVSMAWSQGPGKAPQNSVFGLIDSNEIVGASADFSRLWGSDLIMSKNKFLGGYTPGSVDGNHDDGGQGAALPACQMKKDAAGVVIKPVSIDTAIPCAEYSNILIEDNIFIDRINLAQNLWSGYQGLFSIFDGVYYNVVIRRNVSMGGAYHSISLYGVQGAEISNNISLSTDVAGSNSYNKFWINTPNSKFGLPSTNVVVKNNIANQFGSASSTWVVNTNNHVLKNENAASVFEKFDPVNGVYDFHIKPTSALYGKGLGIYDVAN